MTVESRSANQTLLDIIDECRRQSLSTGDTLVKCNEWQAKRMETEAAIFGSPITRELTQNDVREAIYFLSKGRFR